MPRSARCFLLPLLAIATLGFATTPKPPASAAVTSIGFFSSGYATGLSSIAAAIGDFNGDGRLDFAVTNYCYSTGCGGTVPTTISVYM